MITESEATITQVQNRYDRLCNMINWDYEMRHIGRVLLLHRAGLTFPEMVEHTGLKRMTIVRRVNIMVGVHVAQIVAGVVSHTAIGRQYHLATNRELRRIIAGLQVGLSPALLTALSKLPGISSDMLQSLASVSYVKYPLPEEFTVILR